MHLPESHCTVLVARQEVTVVLAQYDTWLGVPVGVLLPGFPRLSHSKRHSELALGLGRAHNQCAAPLVLI